MSTPRLPTTPSLAERTAAASVVAVVAGLTLPLAISTSVIRAVLVWLTFSIFAGLLLGTKTHTTIRKTVAHALLPSAMLPVSYAGYWFVHFLADWSSTPDALPRVVLGTLDPTSSVVQILLAVTFLLIFGATLFVVSLASIGKRLLVAALAKANRFGPEGFERMHKIVVAIGGIVTAIIALWVSFG